MGENETLSNDDSKSNPKYISRVTTDTVRALINRTGRAIFRERSDDDIGMDGEIELIKLTSKEQIPTGNVAFIQLKGSRNIIQPLKTTPEISVSVKHTTLKHLKSRINFPVILIYSSADINDNFYFCDLRATFGENLQSELGKNTKESTVRIPIKNNFKENPEEFFRIIMPDTHSIG